jgi:OOP family OmpA-OmpF porin
LVVGHTDAVGGVDFNQRLSVRRAEAVRNFLVEHGLPAGNVTIRGEGKLKPVTENATAKGRSRNRRVEIVVQ